MLSPPVLIIRGEMMNWASSIGAAALKRGALIAGHLQHLSVRGPTAAQLRETAESLLFSQIFPKDVSGVLFRRHVASETT